GVNSRKLSLALLDTNRNGQAGLTSSVRSGCVTSSDVESGCASGASCAQLCGVLFLVDDWPCVLLWGIGEETMHGERKDQKVFGRNQHANSIQNSPIVSRSPSRSFSSSKQSTLDSAR